MDEAATHLDASKKSVSWTSTFVTTVLQENERRSDVPFVVQTVWTPPYIFLTIDLEEEELPLQDETDQTTVKRDLGTLRLLM